MADLSTLFDDNVDAVQAGRAEELVKGPVVVEARGLRKTFQIPEHRVDSLKERVVRPFARTEHRELRAVRDVSFEVHRGEFFGIVGRNGSGKSTLLKILAGIYGADAGRVRVAGRVAPFIELGVGFNPELVARDNVVLNGVLLGLSRREALRRLDAVLDFAELRDFGELKLKNYSSGMMVRLAFAIMVQADADIMLIDEVLAVGDAAFGQKCMDVFHEKRRAGKTVILVTHDMASVQALCHRALLMQDGHVVHVGDAEETALRYLRLNFDGPAKEDEHAQVEGDRALVPSNDARVVAADLRSADGTATDNFEQGAPMAIDVVVEAQHDLDSPLFVFHVLNEDNTVVVGFTVSHDGRVEAGSRVRVGGDIENRLVPGRYWLTMWVRWGVSERDVGVRSFQLKRFLVYGTSPRFGFVDLGADLRTAIEPPADGDA